MPFWTWAVLDKIRKYFERPSGRPGGRASRVNPHVLRVRSGFYALSVSKLAAPTTPAGIGFNAM
ncbi:hypothetical protein D4N05_03775 [Klebsiella oxytoca]|nr:hypothetical protein D4N05_03775 [Klebsiella oxytoca]